MFLILPPELALLVLQELGLDGMARVSPTCRAFRTFRIETAEEWVVLMPARIETAGGCAIEAAGCAIEVSGCAIEVGGNATEAWSDGKWLVSAALGGAG